MSEKKLIDPDTLRYTEEAETCYTEFSQSLRVVYNKWRDKGYNPKEVVMIASNAIITLAQEQATAYIISYRKKGNAA